MKKRKKIPGLLVQPFVLLFFFFLFSQKAYSLVPLENLILGDFSENYKEEQNDPLKNIFQLRDENKFPLERKRQLALYRGFVNEGLNFKNSCQFNKGLSYPTLFDHDQAVRSFLAQMQMMGLDITVRALVSYLKYFDFTEEEFERLSDSLVGNYCSKNLSVISLKELKKNMMVKFTKENSYITPHIDKNPLFSSSLNETMSENKIKEQELYQTLRLFRNFCSWGGEVHNARMLVPFLRNPFIFSHIAREMSSLELDWNSIDNTISLKKNEKSEQVYCSHLICRKVAPGVFIKKFPRMLGSQTLYNDFKRMYCEEFRDLNYVSQGQNSKISQWIKDESFDDEILVQGQLISLWTGIPDLFFRMEKFKDSEHLLRQNIDKAWNQWAVAQIGNFDKYLYYEENLSIEKVDTTLYFDPYNPEFKVVFDINLGEADRINQVVGKIKTVMNFKVSKPLLQWLRFEWITLGPKKIKEKEHLVTILSKNIEEQIKKAKDNFRVSPWSSQFSKLVSREILQQMEYYQGQYFNSLSAQSDFTNIPIVLNYGPFALKYLSEEYLLNNSSQNINIEAP